MSTMVIGLASGSIEKLLMASTLTGGAVALDMEVHIYLLLGGAYAFRKDVAGKGTYTDRPELEDEMRAGVCGTAGRIWGAGEPGDFVDICDDVVGIASYLMHCEEAEVVRVL